MDEYVRKEDASDAVIKHLQLDYEYAWGAREAINALPSADVTPVIHSRWIQTADGEECENCGREAVYQIVDDHWEYEPWCPHCGAKMMREG